MKLSQNNLPQRGIESRNTGCKSTIIDIALTGLYINLRKNCIIKFAVIQENRGKLICISVECKKFIIRLLENVGKKGDDHGIFAF